MAFRHFSVVAGARPRDKKAKGAQPAPQDAIAKRWRQDAGARDSSRQDSDVIPLMEGWVRVLEKQAGSYPAAESR
jgi:hypothetical protein